MRIAALVIFAAACVLAQENPAQPTEPVQIARWLVEDVWNKGDLRFADRMFTADATLHFRGTDRPLTPETGLQIVKAWRTGFPDFHFRLEDIIVEGNKVALRIPFTGTHLGRFWGLNSTGRKIAVTETLILRIQGGKIVEMWEDFDEYEMRVQLGLLQRN